MADSNKVFDLVKDLNLNSSEVVDSENNMEFRNFEDINKAAENLAISFLNKKKAEISTWNKEDLSKEFKNYIWEDLGVKDKLQNTNINSVDDLFNMDSGVGMIQETLFTDTDSSKKKDLQNLKTIIQAQMLNEIGTVLFDATFDYNDLQTEITKDNAVAKEKIENPSTGSELRQLYKTVIASQNSDNVDPNGGNDGTEENNDSDGQQDQSEQPDSQENGNGDMNPEDGEGGNGATDTDDNGTGEENNGITLKEGHKDIATGYNDTEAEKAQSYKSAEKAKIKKKQDKIRKKSQDKAAKLLKKAEEKESKGKTKKAEKLKKKAQAETREGEIKASAVATKNERITRKNVGKSFYAVIHNYKEQQIFSEEVNEDVLKRIPLETWREFNNIFS